jgi:hypothetical protein
MKEKKIDLDGCGCAESSITKISEGVRLIRKFGIKCLGCLSLKIRKKVLKRVERKGVVSEIGG